MKYKYFYTYWHVNRIRDSVLAGCLGLLLFIFNPFLWSSVMAQDIPQTSQRPYNTRASGEDKLPINIESDLMEAMDKSGIVVFTGHVKATRGDLTINSEKLEVFYEKRKGGEDTTKAVEKIIATGQVRITQGERIGTGHRAIYEKPAEKITITGEAQVWEGPNRVSGERIIFFINEDRSVVEGNSKTKVKAVVYPEE
jgi:lipopolysaccharide export system protein LptA